MEQTITTVSNQEAGPSQFLSFVLGGEEYGVEILKVQEIKGYSSITPVPNMPSHIKGVMNLRGMVVPVIDLRNRFGMTETPYNQFTVIILVNVVNKVTGLVVDAVSDVLNLKGGEIQPAPEFGSQVDTRFISGMVNIGERLVVLLNIELLLGDCEVFAVACDS